MFPLSGIKNNNMDRAKVFLGLSQILKVLIITCIVKSVSTLDCSPPSRNFTCDCDDTILQCTGIQTSVAEIQDILATTSSVPKVIIKIAGLQFDPNFRFENMSITNLTLGYGLQTPPADLFGGLGSSLVSLNLQNNSIRDIDDQLLFPLSNLTELFLDINELHDLNSRMFSNLPSLKYLSITSNDIEVINPDVFQDLSSLHTLLLSSNNITLFENVNIKSSSLYALKVSDCFIQGVLENDTFSDLPGLGELDISYNELTQVKPNSLSSLKNLKFLNLSNNIIQYLQENAFAELSNLTSLDLKNNKINLIKRTSFANLLSLKYLDLSGNKLKAILCEYTTDFPALEQIYLQNNEIKTFTAGALFYSRNLKELDITGNNLECSCDLTDIVNYLIANSTVEGKVLKSVSCVEPSTNAGMLVTDYKSGKCVQEEPCQKITPSSFDDDYDYDYNETESNAETTTEATDPGSNVTSSNTSTVTNIATIAYASSSTGNVTSSDSPSTETTTVSITTLNPATTSVQSSLNSTEIITIADDINTSEPENTTIEMTTPSENSTDYITDVETETSEATDLGITPDLSSTKNLTTLSTTTTTITPSTTEIPTTAVDVKGIYSASPKIPCTSLELLVDDLSSDSEITVAKNFTYDDTTFCLKWTVPGTLPPRLRCTIKYTNINGTKVENLKCPSSSNKIMLWSRNGTVYSFCLEIYAGKKIRSCAKVSDKTTTALTNTPVATTEMSEQPTTPSTAFSENNTVSLTYAHTDTTSENATFESTKSTAHSVASENATFESTKSTAHSVTSENATFESTKSTAHSVTSEPDVSSTRFISVYYPFLFEITSVEVHFNDSSFAYIKWSVNKEEPADMCNLTLTASTQYFDHDEGIFSCKNNTHQLQNVKEDEIFKICLRSHHKRSGDGIKCTYSIDGANFDVEASESAQKSGYTSSLIPLICLLVLLVLVVIFIIIKNLYGKKHISERRYDVRAEEEKSGRVQVRSASDHERTSVRYSYIAKENSDI